jgi:hypothetical protein
MPKVTTKYLFRVGEVDTKEKLVDSLNSFAEYLESTYARIQVSVPDYDFTITTGTASIVLNNLSRQITIVLKATVSTDVTITDHVDNPCSVGTLVEVKFKKAGATNRIDIGGLGMVSVGGVGYSSLYYFKGTSGWEKLN